MTRSLISLETDDRKWLEIQSAKTGKSMSHIVRVAVRLLRETEEKSFNDLLSDSSGVWKKGDGLQYQTRVREEWD